MFSVFVPSGWSGVLIALSFAVAVILAIAAFVQYSRRPLWQRFLIALAVLVVGPFVILFVILLIAMILVAVASALLGILSYMGTILFAPVAPAPVAPPVVIAAPAAPVAISPYTSSTAGQPQTCGLIFPAFAGGSLNTNYDVRVDCWQDGSWHLRGWQFRLPSNRVAHSVAFQIPRGQYTFDGVSCKLYLDEQRNGNGSTNPMVAANGNNLPFSVGVDVANALVECNGGPSSGFDYLSR